MDSRKNKQESGRAPDRKERSKLSCLREKLGEKVIIPPLLGMLENLTLILPPPAIKRLAFFLGIYFIAFLTFSWLKPSG